MYALIAIVSFIVFIVAMRLLGAWMLRINEVISNQKIIIIEIKRMNGSLPGQQANKTVE